MICFFDMLFFNRYIYSFLNFFKNYAQIKNENKMLTLRRRNTYIYVFRALFGYCNFEATSCGFWKLGVSSLHSTLDFE